MALPDKNNISANDYTEALIVFALALLAAVLIKMPELFGVYIDQNEGFYIRNLSLFALPLITVYFAWKRQINRRDVLWLTIPFLAAILFVNVYPFAPDGDTQALSALHLPVALWLVVGIAYSGGHWRKIEDKMAFIRFSGELFIYYILIALGGMVLTGFMAFMFQTIGIDIEPFFERWILPCGTVGAILIASWLVEIKQGFTENLAPMLARLFSPLFAVVLIIFLVALTSTGHGMEIGRDILIAFDTLLVVILGLLLYSIYSRNKNSPPGILDGVQITLLMSALIVDILVLWAVASRITEFGFTPNRVAGLALNLILLVNLAWSAILYLRFLLGKGSFSTLEKWQTDYLPVFAIWAAIVVILFPPLFGYA